MNKARCGSCCRRGSGRGMGRWRRHPRLIAAGRGLIFKGPDAEAGTLLWSCVTCRTNPAPETRASSSGISKTEFCCPSLEFLQRWVQFQSTISEFYSLGVLRCSGTWRSTLEIQSAALAFEDVPTGWQAAPNVR